MRVALFFIVLAQVACGLLGAIVGLALLGPAVGNVYSNIEAELAPTAYYGDLPHAVTEDGGFVLGSPNAVTTIVVFEDFACPHCQDYHHNTLSAFIETYVRSGQAKFESHILPTAGGQTTAYTGALLECANTALPGAYWLVYPGLFARAEAGQYSSDGNLAWLAQRLGLNAMELSHCAATAGSVAASGQLARSVGAGGTPATYVRYGDGDLTPIVIGGTRYSGQSVTMSVISDLLRGSP